MVTQVLLLINQFSRQHGRLSLVLLLALGLLVRLPFLTTDHRISGDLEDFRAWARTIDREGVVALSQASSLTLYPPLALYLFGGAGFIESHLPEYLRHGDGALNALIKLPSILAEIATAGLLFWVLRDRSPAFRLGGAALTLFNPGVWYISSYWGQNDAVYTIFLAVLVVALGWQKVLVAWLAFGLALCAKQQSIVIAPLLCIITLRQYGLPKFIGGLAISGGIGLTLTAPWWSTDHLADLMQAIAFTPKHINEGAYNAWYLLLWGQIHDVGIDVHPAGLPLSYNAIAWGAYAACTLLAAIWVWNGDQGFPIALPAAVMTMAAFMLLPSMHERYAMPVLIFLLLAASGREVERPAGPLWWAYGLLTAIMFFNLITIASFLPDLWTNIAAYQPPYPPLIAALKGLALLAAAANTGVFIRLAAGLKKRSESHMNRFIPTELYHRILENVPIACVDIAVVAQGAVLLVQRNDPPAQGQWWVPGGRVLKGEMMRETALRKAREEVGIDCHVGPLIHTAETIFPDGPGGIPVHSINSCFFVYPVDPTFNLHLDDNHTAYQWVNHIPPGIHPYVKRCLMGAGLSRHATTEE